MDGNAAVKDIAKFLPFMGDIGICRTARFQCKADGFHDVLLGIWNDPFNLIFQVRIDFFKKILIVDDDLFIGRCAEKFLQVRSKALQDIYQRCDGR